MNKKNILFILCLCSGIAILAARWIPSEVIKIVYGALITVFFLALSLLLKRTVSTQLFWEPSFAFFIFSFIQLLNNSIPFYFQQYILREIPVPGNPLGSTIFGSIIIQLIETLIAVIPIIIFTKISGKDLKSIYVNKGKIGKWFLFSVIAFFIFYVLAFRISSHSFFPTHGFLTFNRFLSLTPALLLMVILNGVQEELLFRGLFLKKFTNFFGTYSSNFLQAGIFAVAHIGITYTASTATFILLFVLPLGLFMGSLTRKTDSILAPAIFHAGTDIPIYLSFLTYVM